MPPERRLSAELRRAESLRNPPRPPMLSRNTRTFTTFSATKAFDAEVIAAVFNSPNDYEGKS